MADTIQFTLTPGQMARFLAWRAQVEAETGSPIEGVVFSFLLTIHGYRQIIIRPSTDQDLKLKGIERIDGTYDTFAPHEEVLAEYEKQIPVGRIGKPEDVANAVLFFASEESGYITGQTLPITGGWF